MVLIGKEAFDTWRLHQLTPWMMRYRWPILFFVGVAFWNLVGAGIFGFLINPPVALFYMQGLNTTATHGHAALFGVYAGVKAGVHAITMVAAREWGVNNITCNSIIPVFYSDLSNKLFKEHGEQMMKDMIPLGYIGDVDKDIAPVMVFMASDDSRYITGQMIKVDGGTDIHF